MTDVWIEARYGGSVAVMYWRVLYVDGTLDFTAQVYPRFFTFLPDDAPPPAPGSPTKNFLENMLARQEGNRRKAMDVLAVLEGERTLAGVAGAIGMPFDDLVNDRTSPYQGRPRGRAGALGSPRAHEGPPGRTGRS